LWPSPSALPAATTRWLPTVTRPRPRTTPGRDRSHLPSRPARSSPLTSIRSSGLSLAASGLGLRRTIWTRVPRRVGLPRSDRGRRTGGLLRKGGNRQRRHTLLLSSKPGNAWRRKEYAA
jgi:hypothetical protein